VGYAKHVGRVGALAVALGIGTAVITTPGIAWADDGTTSNVDKDTVNETPNNPSNDTPDQHQAAPESHVGNAEDPGTGTGTGTGTGSGTGAGTGTGTGSGTSIGVDGGPEVTLNVQTVTTTPTPTVDPTPVTHTPPVIPPPTTPPTVGPVVVTPTGTVDDNNDLQVLNPGTSGTPLIKTDSLKPSAPPSPNPTAGLPAGEDDHQLPTMRMFNTQTVDTTSTSNLFQANTFSALVAPALPVPTVPPPTLFETLIAIPGTVISTALNLITQALAPLIGPGAPADNPVLWAVLAFVRRQFNQSFANSSPVLAPRQTGQDLDDAQVHGTFGGTDADGDRLTYSVPTSGLGAPVHGTVAIDQATGTYTYTPTSGYVGKDYFFVTANDSTSGPHIHALGQTNLAAARVDVTVAATTAPNTAPAATKDTFTAVEDTALTTGNVLINDNDADGDHLSATLVTGPSHAANFSLKPDGTFSYTPAANYNGPDSFSYKAFDGTVAGNTATAAITVTAVNDAPIAVNDTFTTTANTAFTAGNVLTNDTDVDGNTLRAAPESKTTAQGGTVAIRGDGTFTYTPKTDFSGADTFTYTVKDGSQTANDAATGTVTVMVKPAVGPLPTAPVVGKPDVDGVVTGTVNGVVPGGPAATYSLDGRPQFADQFTLDATTGQFTYRPTDAARIASTAGGADYDVFTVQLLSSAGTSIVPITVDIAPPTAVVPVTGAAAGPIVVASNGFSYQLVEDETGATAVQVVSPAGRSILTAPLPGAVQGQLIARANGDVVVVTTTGGATTSSFARAAAVPATPDVHVSLIDANGRLTSTSVSGLPIGTAAVAADGTVYQTVRTTEPIILFGNDRTIPNFVVVRVSPAGEFSTVTAGTVPGGKLYADPLAVGGTDFAKSGVVVGADGTAYQGFSGVILAPDGNSYETKVGVLVIPKTGNAYLSTLYTGDSASQVVAAGAATAYLSYRGFDPTDFGAPTWTAVLTVTPTGTTTYTVPDSEDPFASPARIAVGPGGTVYQAVDKDGNVTVSVRQTNSVTTSSTVPSSTTVGDLHVSDAGVAYQLVAPSGGSADRLVVLKSDGGFNVVPLGAAANGNLQVGPDGSAFVDGGNQIVVVTPSGVRTAIPLGGTSASDIAFASDGTAYQAVLNGKDLFIKNLTTGDVSDTVPTASGRLSGGNLVVGPDGTAVFTGSDGSSVTPTKILAMNAFGTTIVNVSVAGAVSGPVTFGADGTAYVASTAFGSSGNPPRTTVSAITSAGVTTVLDATGYPSTLAVANDGTIHLSLTTYTATGEGSVQTYRIAAVSNPPAPGPTTVTVAKPNLTTGVVTGTVATTAGASIPGVTVVYSGSTSSVLGTVLVNTDGSFTFTPSAEGRQFAQSTNKVSYADFLVKATDSRGGVSYTPISVPLLPTDYPTTEAPPIPLRLHEFTYLPGGVTGHEYGPSDYFKIKVSYTLYGPDKKIVSTTEGWTRNDEKFLYQPNTSSLDLAEADVYVLSTIYPAGETTNPYVVGYRKMETGDTITVHQNTPSDTAQTVRYKVVAFAPGTFPTDLFHTRADGVGGYIFNNEIPESVEVPWQYQMDDEENIADIQRKQSNAARDVLPGIEGTLTGYQLLQGARLNSLTKAVTVGKDLRTIYEVKTAVNGTKTLVPIALADDKDNEFPIAYHQGADDSAPQIGA
jgi:VCBS repeat-containing protein